MPEKPPHPLEPNAIRARPGGPPAICHKPERPASTGTHPTTPNHLTSYTTQYGGDLRHRNPPPQRNNLEIQQANPEHQLNPELAGGPLDETRRAKERVEEMDGGRQRVEEREAN